MLLLKIERKPTLSDCHLPYCFLTNMLSWFFGCITVNSLSGDLEEELGLITVVEKPG